MEIDAITTISSVANATSSTATLLTEAISTIHSSKCSSVRVAVRVRPLLGREKVERCDECVQVLDQDTQVIIGKNRSFTYDYTFSKYAQQSDIWKCVEPLVLSFMEGYNATIFAYGQTGSGKTYTMGTGSCTHSLKEEYGIIPRVIEQIFQDINMKRERLSDYKITMQIRFLEVYGEEIRDLLFHASPFTDSNMELYTENMATEGRSSSHQSRVILRESENGEVQVIGAAEEAVTCVDDCFRLLERGTLSRTTASTLMNAHSSRSHAIFTITMTQHISMDRDSESNAAEEEMKRETLFETRTSYFNFVDLAGSERQKRTQAEGKRLKEGIEINKGLLALGNVISALGDDKKRGRAHIPYRDSKLTRMLQDSLGGNSRTLMLTCVSPADLNFEETLNALKYANRARNIKNKAVVNRDEASNVTYALKQQIQSLQEEVIRLRNPGMSDNDVRRVLASNFHTSCHVPSSASDISSIDHESYTEVRSRAEIAEAEVSRLTSELKRFRLQMDHLKEEMIVAQAERDYFRLCVEDQTSGLNESSSLVDKRAEKMNVMKEQLRTISTLQETLREVERQRDSAILKLDESGVTPPESVETLQVPSFIESDVKVGNALIEQVEKELERDAAALKQMTVNDVPIEIESDMDTESALILQTQEDVERQRVFQRRQKHLGDSVQDLSHDISLKEQLVQNIRQSQENYERLKSFYERKMVQMVEAVRLAQLDRDRLVEEMQSLELKISQEGGLSSGNGQLAKLARDLKVKEGELSDLRRKQSDINRFITQKKKSEMQLRVLNAEISNMKRQKVDLMKKMQTERKRFEEEANCRRKEITFLKRAQIRDKQQIQRLGSQKEAQERVLKRKMEEIAATKLKLKQQQQVQVQARKLNTSLGTRSVRWNNSKVPGRDVEWLSKEVKKRAEEQEKLEKLQKERIAVTKEMKALYARRNRMQQELQQSFQTQNSIRDVLISPIKDEQETDKKLSPEEEQIIFDLEEQIEACQVQLEYNEDKISEMMSHEMHGTQADLTTSNLTPIDTTQSLPEARTLLKMLFGMAVELKKTEQRKKQQISTLQVDVTDLNKMLEQERERVRQLKLTYNESLQRIFQCNPKKENESFESLSFHLEKGQTDPSALEQHNTCLMKRCDEMEAQRKELCDQIASQRRELKANQARIQWFEKMTGKHPQDDPMVQEDDDFDVDMTEAKRNELEAQELAISTAPYISEGHNSESEASHTEDHDADHSTSSIFSRLSNPRNFTGIHKIRVRDNANKREVIQLRSERNRARRVRDRSQLRPVRAVTLSERPSGTIFAAGKKKKPVLGILKSMKGEKETDGDDVVPLHEQESVMEGADLRVTMPPPVPQPSLDVYSRLAGQYTASAQSKRQKASGRRSGSEVAPSTPHSPRHQASSPNRADIVEESAENALSEKIEEILDPLLGGGSFLAQVHEDYRERISQNQGNSTEWD
uniref:Kinesinlike protein putative n=1 Tax=Albugo laibachii Nc14 TaxID=890382 RepID=F0W9M5_9STRA|nr:kinesinlike protein putative [Albugo laibachii Nc14]|eukprot:CCA17843.1 kinesinlike protein putative [Albugo laibachii Nc14]